MLYYCLTVYVCWFQYVTNTYITIDIGSHIIINEWFILIKILLLSECFVSHHLYYSMWAHRVKVTKFGKIIMNWLILISSTKFSLFSHAHKHTSIQYGKLGIDVKRVYFWCNLFWQGLLIITLQFGFCISNV